ncbi:MAG: HPF/RaiA family ribosome-associated protein [Pirellulales bacterium]
MKLPLQISFHNLERSESIENRIREEAAQLDEFCGQIMSCRVVVDVPHRHHLTGNVYQIRVDIKVPREEIAVVHEPAEHDPSYKDVNVAIRDAFDAAARRLEDYVRRQRKDVKHHDVRTPGRVARLFPEARYGFIETPDNREIYFHANSVLDDKFDALSIGTEIIFVEEPGDKGPQASTVRIVGRHHHVA